MSIARFVGTTFAAFLVYGILYMAGAALAPEAMASMATAMVSPEETFVATMAYHLVQTVAVVWLFDKAVGSGDVKAGAMFGFMVGLYLMASNSIWFTNLKEFPQDARMIMSVMDLAVGTIIGLLLAKLHDIGRGGDASAE